MKFLAALPLLAAPFTSPLAAQCAPAKPQAKPQAKTQAVRAAAVTLRASTDAVRYTPGAPIGVRLEALNRSRRTQRLDFSSGQRFDFSVFRVGGREPVYTWSASRMFLQARGAIYLRPGQKQEFDASVGNEMGTLGPGRYTLRARLSNSPRPIVAAPVAFEIVDLGLNISARTDKSTYKIGEPVKIDISVANRARRENRVPFASGMTFDVLVYDESERLVWNYGANLRFIQVLGSLTWRTGEVKNFSTEWDGTPLPGEAAQPPRLAPGRYKVQAVLASSPQLFAEPVFIDVAS